MIIGRFNVPVVGTVIYHVFQDVSNPGRNASRRYEHWGSYTGVDADDFVIKLCNNSDGRYIFTKEHAYNGVDRTGR